MNALRHIAVGDLSLVYREAWMVLQINGRTPRLTATEYRVCLVFLRALEQTGVSAVLGDEGLTILTYISRSRLQTQGHIANHRLLDRHISTLNAKLRPCNLHIHRMEDRGYLLLALTPSAASTKRA